MKRIKLTDTRGVTHSVIAADIEQFSAGFDPFKRPCVEVVYDDELIFACCTIEAFTDAWGAAVECDENEPMYGGM